MRKFVLQFRYNYDLEWVDRGEFYTFEEAKLTAENNTAYGQWRILEIHELNV